jgi:hypothetical protein
MLVSSVGPSPGCVPAFAPVASCRHALPVPRHLPVLNPPSEDQASLDRPRWHWVLIGAVLGLAVFMPLSTVASWIGARLAVNATSSGLAALGGSGPVMVAFGFSAWASGAMVGRFSAARTPEVPAAAGALGGALVLGLAALGGALRPWPVALGAATVLVLGGALAALVGGRFGIRRRP